MRKIWYISSNLNSNLHGFHCAHPNVYAKTIKGEPKTYSSMKVTKAPSLARMYKAARCFHIAI